MVTRRIAELGLSLYLILTVSADILGEDTLNGHRVVLDSEGKLISWVQPQERAYDQVMRLAWDFLLHTVPTESNGLKTYLTYCCMDPIKLRGTDWPHNPAGLYGMFADSVVAYYAYSGDRDVVRLVQEMLDYQLAHGTTPAGWSWAKIPYASSDAGSKEYFGADDSHYNEYCGKIEMPGIARKELEGTIKTPCGTGDGHYVIEADKVGELGIGYLNFFELTGEARYRDAAIACANALARHVRPGDAGHSPWPFRVFAETNKVREEYTSNVIGPIRLFDELVRLSLGDTLAYHQAREMAWKWMMTFPMQNNHWAGYFEDVQIFNKPVNFNQYSALETARYILIHPGFDPDWRAHVSNLIQWVGETFVVDVPKEPAIQWGANAVSEQIEDKNKMGSHTSRYASANALWYEKTGETAAKEKAFRSFNWASYMCRENGAVLVGPVDQSIWFSDGYGDYIRHFMAGLGSVPEWAPPGENHVLRSTSIVQDVSYHPSEVDFSTFDDDSTEVLRLNFVPSRVAAAGKQLSQRNDLSQPGWTFDERSSVLRIRHQGAREIRVLGSTSR